MSRKADREDRLIDRLQQENRILKQENKRLKKQLKSLNKGFYKFMIAEDEEDEKEAVQEAKEVAKKICFTCKTGTLQLVDLITRYYRQCDNCTYRTKSKPISELKK